MGKSRINKIMKKILNAIEKFEKKKILVIGDIMLDQYCYGQIKRINPEAPAPLVNIEYEKYFLGGAANVANNITSLHGETYLVGVIGDDKEGEKVVELCRERKIGIDYLIMSDEFNERRTTLKRRIVVDNNQIVRSDYEKTDEINNFLELKLLNGIKEYIKDVDCVAFSDYDKGTLTKKLSQKVIKLAEKNKVLVLTDPKPQNISFFKNSHLIRPNHHEAAIIAHMNYKNGDNLHIIADKIKKITKAKYIVISCGKDGLFVYDNGKSKSIETRAKELVDVTGAGDTVLGGLSLGLTSDLNIYESSELANIMAGIVVGKVGTATVTREELTRAIKNNK